MDYEVNEVQQALARLETRGWTLSAVSRDTGIPRATIQQWKTGRRSTTYPSMVVKELARLEAKKRVPKEKYQRRTVE